MFMLVFHMYQSLDIIYYRLNASLFAKMMLLDTCVIADFNWENWEWIIALHNSIYGLNWPKLLRDKSWPISLLIIVD